MTNLGPLIRSKRKALGISQTRLGEIVGVSQTTVSDWEKGDTSQIRDWKRLADALGVDQQEFLDAMSEKAIVDGMQRLTTAVRENIHLRDALDLTALKGVFANRPITVTMDDAVFTIDSASQLAALFAKEPPVLNTSQVKAIEAPEQGRRDVPVFGKAQGGDSGVFEFNGEVLGWEIRPPMLEGVSSAYAVYVDGDSMYPRYRPGETVWVNPNKVPARGDDVIIQLHPMEDGDPPRGFIKEFVAWKPNTLVAFQHNPSGEITFEKWQIKSIHAIVFAQK